MKKTSFYRLATGLLLAATLSACNGATGQGPNLSSETTPDVSQAPGPKTTVQKFNYTFGPFKLSAKSGATPMANKDGKLSFRVDTPVWMTGFEPHVVDAKGNAISGDVVQLVVLSNNSEANPLCTTRQTGNPFAATTSLLQKVALPDGYGYPLLPEDVLEAKIVLRNSSEEDLRDIYFSFTLTAEPMDVASQKKDVMPLLLDTDPCDHTPISVPPGGMIQKKASSVIPEDGGLIKAVGLLQNYGMSVAIDAGKDKTAFTWSTMSQLNDAHQIISLESFESSKGAPIKKDESIQLEVVYDNFSGDWMDDATAAAMIYIARDSQVSGTERRPSSDGSRTENQPTITATTTQKLLF
ncbi:MAG: hypothetical protein COV45_00415 [Deltaproteobacteria bacterium CG11_big_fil_rev_8_21_14_0_20_47_16]|nr:MAG: hypothetical protein COV45_00415 [Deltaproteobacteria bacterium CG11_big_fil_rev_8_21_14_0_20_47_16]